MKLSKTYWHDRGHEYTSAWHLYYFGEVLEFLKDFNLLPGTIIEYGCYEGKMLDHLIKKYPNHEIIGIDFYNINSHPNIIEMDIKDFNSNYNLTLGLNDLVDYKRDLKSKIAGRNHALNNLIKGGIYVESSSCPVKEIEGLDLLKSSKYVSFFIKK